MQLSSLQVQRKNPRTLIENRIDYAGANAELSIYDTYESCKAVGLNSEEVTFCGMLSGKKVVHHGDETIDFTPRQSFVLSPGQHIDIDFPDANKDAPTSCMTIQLTKKSIQQVCDRLNMEGKEYQNTPEAYYRESDFLHQSLNISTQSLLERLVRVFSEDASDRDILVELGVSELIVRMMRQQTRNFLLSQIRHNPEKTGLHLALHAIESNLQDGLDIDTLSKIACMSRSKFFREFKHALGCSPAEYIMQKRIERAAKQLRQGKSVAEAAIESGFVNMSHFSRRFYQRYGLSPRAFSQMTDSAVLENGIPEEPSINGFDSIE